MAYRWSRCGPRRVAEGRWVSYPPLGSLQGPGQAEGFTVSVVWTLEGWGAGHAQTHRQGWAPAGPPTPQNKAAGGWGGI